MCYALIHSGGVGSYARHRFLRFRLGPGWGRKRPLPGNHPTGNHSVHIYIVMERGALCAQMTEGRVAAPLSHYFSAHPRFGAGKICRIFPLSRACTLTTKHIIMISSLTLKQSIVIVDFQFCVDLRGLRPFGRARRSKSKRRDYGERRPSQ